MATKFKWFLLDKNGEDWAPWEGSYSSAKEARAQRDHLNKVRPELAPFKAMERKVEVYELG